MSRGVRVAPLLPPGEAALGRLARRRLRRRFLFLLLGIELRELLEGTRGFRPFILDRDRGAVVDRHGDLSIARDEDLRAPADDRLDILVRDADTRVRAV